LQQASVAASKPPHWPAASRQRAQSAWPPVQHPGPTGCDRWHPPASPVPQTTGRRAYAGAEVAPAVCIPGNDAVFSQTDGDSDTSPLAHRVEKEKAALVLTAPESP